MALKRYKDAIEIQKDDAIKRNQIYFDLVLRMFNHLNELNVKGKSLSIDTILTYSQKMRVQRKLKTKQRQKYQKRK